MILGAAVITDPPKNQTAAEGHGVSFECKGEANPGNISVAWFKDGLPIQSVTSPNFEASVTSDGTLMIKKAKSEAQGRYTCKVSNGIGRPIEATAYLAIECRLNVLFTSQITNAPPSDPINLIVP